MSVNPFTRALRGACRGDPAAIESLVAHLAPAIMLEARMQLRDHRLWQQEGGVMRRGILKRLVERISIQEPGLDLVDELGRLAVRLIENKARNYLHRRAASPV
jgi:hypothetical protein